MNKEIVVDSVRVRVSAIIICGGKILLIHRIKNGQEYRSFPGGGVEPGESDYEALRREVLEETGKKVSEATLLVKAAREGGEKVDAIFVCEIEENGGKLVLGGPEAERNGKNNYYKPEWVTLDQIENLPLHPKKGKKELERLLKGQDV